MTPEQSPLAGVELCQFSLRENAAEAEILIRRDCPLFEGHFPDGKVLPGVALVGIAERIGQRLHGEREMERIERCKLLAPVLPGDALRLCLRWRDPLLLWEVHRGAGRVAVGRLVMKPGGR